MQKKLDSAKSLAKQMSTNLSEQFVQQGKSEGKLTERIKELELSNAALQKLLQESQNQLKAMSATTNEVSALESTATASTKGALIQRVVRSGTKTIPNTKVDSDYSDPDSATVTTALTALKSLTSAQIKKKPKKELENILIALSVMHDPITGKRLKELGKAVLISLLEAELKSLS